MAILVFGLNLMPCADEFVQDADFEISISVQQDCDTDHHGLDDCTPFCVCSCCHTVTTYVEPGFGELQPNPTGFGEMTGMIQPATYSPHYSIWEPPKIV